MNIRMCKIEFETDNEMLEKDLKKIRGYLGNKFSDYTLLHNHQEEGFRYRYPLIQYKFIKKKFCMIGINEGVDTLLKILPSIEDFELDYKKLNIVKKHIEMWEEEIKVDTGFKIYQFETPYFALNQKNYKLFKESKSSGEKKEMLDKILVGNILSFFKSFDFWTDKRINADIFFERIKIIEFKEQNMIGIKGEFALNAKLPSYIGLGKSVALGNGSIKRR